MGPADDECDDKIAIVISAKKYINSGGAIFVRSAKRNVGGSIRPVRNVAGRSRPKRIIIAPKDANHILVGLIT